MTFDAWNGIFVNQQYSWQNWFEVFCICRGCKKSTVFVVAQEQLGVGEDINSYLSKGKSLVGVYSYEGFIGIKDTFKSNPPEHLPSKVEAIYREAATCLSVGCWNAAAVMFRLCIDVVTRSMLPEGAVVGLNYRTRRDLGLRLDWLLSNGHLSSDLRALSACLHLDGNDAAHVGSLTKADAEDLLDFADALLERIYTEPERLRLAEQRRIARRSSQGTQG